MSSVGQNAFYTAKKIASYAPIDEFEEEFGIIDYVKRSAVGTVACFFHIRPLRHVWSFTSLDTAKMVACSIGSTRLDYCNALLAGEERV